MSGQIRYSDEFKIDAVSQVTERGYSVKEVAERLGISTKSLYTWMAKFSKPQRVTDQEAEVRRLKKGLARVTEERDILKKRRRTSRRMQGEIRLHRGQSGSIQNAAHVPNAGRPSQRFLCMG